MNFNKLLYLLICFLFFLLLTTIVHFYYYSNNKNVVVQVDNESLLTNIAYTPQIISSCNKFNLNFDKKNVILFRYFNNTCSKCIDTFLNEILALQEEIGKDKIWILPAYPDDRNSRIQLRNELAKYNYIHFSSDSLFIPVRHEEYLSYFAYINSEKKIEMVYIPDRNDIKTLQYYFSEIKIILKNNTEN